MKLSKITVSCLSVIVSAGLIAGIFSGCQKDEVPPSDSTYRQNVSKYSFWNNTSDTAMAEYNTYNHVYDFLDECEIKDGSAYSPDGKLRKVLFIGFEVCVQTLCRMFCRMKIMRKILLIIPLPM